MAQLGRDLKHAVRLLRRSPLFAGIVVLVLGFAIGANLIAFAWVDAFFLRQLPVDRPGELVQIWSTNDAGEQLQTFTGAIEVLRTEPLFDGACAFQEWGQNPAEIGGALRAVNGEAMSWDCFQTLGLKSQLGRFYAKAEDLRSDDRVIVLSDSLWRTEFGGDPGVVGREIRYGGARYTVIGIMEPRFKGLDPGASIDVIVPLSQVPLFPELAVRGVVHIWGHFLVRRAPGVTFEQVRARLPVFGPRMLDEGAPSFFSPQQRSDYATRKIVAAPAASSTGNREWLDRRFGSPLYTFLGFSALVLGVACVSVAALLLARGVTRTREMLIRLALGGSAWANFRMLALEGMLLTLGGAAVGVALARVMNGLVAARASEAFRLAFDPGLDLRVVFGLAGLVVAVNAILFGAVAWQVRWTRHASLSQGQRGAALSTRGQKVLLGAQVALTLALVCVGGLLTASQRNLQQLDLGIRSANLSFASLRTDPASAARPLENEYFGELRQRILAVPGVTGVAFSDVAPFFSFVRKGAASLIDTAAPDVDAMTITLDDAALGMLGIPIVAGEGFRDPGGAPREPSAVVTRSLADRWGGDAVIGKHLRVASSPLQNVRVVGISGNAKFGFASLENLEPPTLFVNFWEQQGRQTSWLLIGTAPGAPLDERAVAAAVRSLGRQYASEFRSADRAKADALIENTALAVGSAGFGVFALALAATGLFGLLSYHVASRTPEIGVRMALGARSRDVGRLVLREILPILVVGVTGGLALAFAAAKALSSVAYGIGTHDPRLLAASVLIIAVTALLAGWIPARRAARVDPVQALRNE